MSTLDFNQFLSDHMLDVKTLTLPFTEVHQSEDKLLDKKKAYVKSPNAKLKDIEMVVKTLQNLPYKTSIKQTDDVDPADELQNLEDLESNLVNDDYFESKKYMEDRNTDNNLINIGDYGVNQKILEDFKTKLRLFEREKGKDAVSNLGDFDVTVIDINDHHTNNNAYMENLSESSDMKVKSRTSENINEPIKTKIDENPDDTTYSIHNKLLYGPDKIIETQIEHQDITGRSKPDRFSQMFNKNEMVDDVTTYKSDTKQAEMPPLFQVLNKISNLRTASPRNIMISSQSYKYSVFFKIPEDTTESSINSK